MKFPLTPPLNDPLNPVPPTQPIAPWLGGKRNLAKRLCALIDATPCATYAEPFVGMGGIFLRRTRCPKAEVINDFGRDVANLFRILQRHYPQFLDTLKFQLTTRVEFNRLASTNPDTLTDLERAARFLYLQRTAFGGKVSGRNFGVSIDRPARFNLTTLEPTPQPEQRHDLVEALYTYVKSDQAPTFSVNEFAERHIPNELQDRFDQYMSSKRFPSRAVIRNTSQMAGKLRRRRFKYGTDIEFSAAPEALAEGRAVIETFRAIEQIGVQEETWTRITIKAAFAGEK